jgi:CRP/FNR family transcriptional regulator, nitrogen fixation regulation protein
MMIQSNFRHPEIAASAFPVRYPEITTLIAIARPCASSFYRANEPVYAQGDAVGPLYLLEFGTVRVCRMTADGRRQISAFHFAGEIFGFDVGTEHQSYAESVDGAGIRVLRPSAGESFGPGVLSLALRGLARAQDHLVVLGRMTATEKMAALLLDLLERQESDALVNLPMQRNDIADYLGLTFETVSRVLRVLKDKGLVRLPRIDQIEVLNVGGLETLSD